METEVVAASGPEKELQAGQRLDYSHYEDACRAARARRWLAKGKARVEHPKYGSVIVPHSSNLAAINNAANTGTAIGWKSYTMRACGLSPQTRGRWFARGSSVKDARGRIMTPRRVAQYDPDTGEQIAVFPSMQAAADSIYGAYSGNISAACHGRQQTAYGYKWAFYRITKEGKRKDET